MKISSEIKVPVLIKNGKFASNLPLIKEIVNSYEGCTVDVIFKKRKNKRSNNQNAYYWSCIVPIFINCIKEEWGEFWSSEDMHEFLKTNCNYEEVISEDTGLILRKTRSTTDNSTTEQEDFHEKCRRLAHDFFNTEIPLPDNQIEIKN